MSDFDVVVIGGGQAGLSIGYYLRAAAREFVIFERGRVGETWRSQRWDSFAVNTPNWANGLPGDPYEGDQPDGFYHRDELVEYFEHFAAKFELPVTESVTVTGVDTNGNGFRVTYEDAAGAVDTVTAANIVVASGMMQTPKIPRIRGRFPESLLQLHASDYRSPESLPPGAVVVIGSGQSGCQISVDLIHAGRDVYLCTSKVGRLRRRYRQRDIVAWGEDMGFWNVAVEELPDPAMEFAAQPQVSGVGRYGSTLSLQSMARDGVHLMGRLNDVEDGVLKTDGSLAEHLAFADDRSAEFTRMIEDWISSSGVSAEPVEDDPNDEPAGPEVAESGITELDLTEAAVGSVIWCTGFTADFVDPCSGCGRQRTAHPQERNLPRSRALLPRVPVAALAQVWDHPRHRRRRPIHCGNHRGSDRITMDGGMSRRQPQADASYITKYASNRPFRRVRWNGTSCAL